MKKKLWMLILCALTIVMLAGCGEKQHDTVEIYNKSSLTEDNIFIEIKDGYFYERHENFTVDDNTVAVVIYFSNSEDASWDNEWNNLGN